MVKEQEHLIAMAVRRHKDIFPCTGESFETGSFTREKGRLLFWYNTRDKSTHLVSARIVRSRRNVRTGS